MLNQSNVHNKQTLSAGSHAATHHPYSSLAMRPWRCSCIDEDGTAAAEGGVAVDYPSGSLGLATDTVVGILRFRYILLLHHQWRAEISENYWRVLVLAEDSQG